MYQLCRTSNSILVLRFVVTKKLNAHLTLLQFADLGQIGRNEDESVIESDEANEDANIAVSIHELIAVV